MSDPYGDSPDYRPPAWGGIGKLSRNEYRSTLWNHGLTPNETFVILDDRHGKFYPRGCRGFINDIEIWCKNDAGAPQTITVYIAPSIGMGYTYTEDITIPANAGWAWRPAAFEIMWNYDSLFIWIVNESANVHHGYDTGTPFDGWRSGDEGATWTPQNRRYWFRVVMEGETRGDVPVSGTINIIPIPSVAATRLYTAPVQIPLAETTMYTLDGAGVTEILTFVVTTLADSHRTVCRVYCDGNLSLVYDFLTLNLWGHTALTPAIQLIAYAANGDCYIQITAHFHFRRQLRLTMEAVNTANQTCNVDGLVNMIR